MAKTLANSLRKHAFIFTALTLMATVVAIFLMLYALFKFQNDPEASKETGHLEFKRSIAVQLKHRIAQDHQDEKDEPANSEMDIANGGWTSAESTQPDAYYSLQKLREMKKAISLFVLIRLVQNALGSLIGILMIILGVFFARAQTIDLDIAVDLKDLKTKLITTSMAVLLIICGTALLGVSVYRDARISVSDTEIFTR